MDPSWAEGKVQHSTRTVFVKRRELSDMCYTLAHELGHLVHRSSGYTYGRGEVVSDMFACQLLLLFGVDRRTVSAEYVRSWLDYYEIEDEDWIRSTELATSRGAKAEAGMIWRQLEG